MREGVHRHDDRRTERIGMPEAVLCEPKSPDQVASIVADLAATGEPLLLTRLTADQLAAIDPADRQRIDDDRPSRTAFVNGTSPTRAGRVAVVAAGTSDLAVAGEATRTLEFCGVRSESFVDVGVAGLWRLQERLEEIREADVVIAVAGMDAALVSVLGGLVAAPVVAVPTSVGYGVAAGGTTALNSALASCAQGVVVVNVDNGFGAASAAVRALRLLDTTRPGPTP
ncbi:nickel pincer cofactor biosynthesis protein LarB [Ilumatobacter sp.]|uniref:nickel pincer cofactor biosynthesis protein LarB n=1 Tax=Ilumatobacter sp. TaxID=1967498 RepID=UPI003B520809